MKTLLKEKINLEPYAEDTPAQDPLSEIISNSSSVLDSINLINEHYQLLKEEFPDYIDFEYKYDYQTYGCGAKSAWFNLFGIKEESYEK